MYDRMLLYSSAVTSANKKQFIIEKPNLASTRKYNFDDILRNYMGI